MHDFPTPDVWLAHRVSYGETDTMGYLYYAEYLHLFERSRSEYIRQMGMSYAEVERLGIMLPVREAQCRYRRPARYDDLIHIRAGIAEVRRASLVFVYNVMDAERKTLLAEGMTEHACTGRDGRPCAHRNGSSNSCAVNRSKSPNKALTQAEGRSRLQEAPFPFLSPFFSPVPAVFSQLPLNAGIFPGSL